MPIRICNLSRAAGRGLAKLNKVSVLWKKQVLMCLEEYGTAGSAGTPVRVIEEVMSLLGGATFDDEAFTGIGRVTEIVLGTAPDVETKAQVGKILHQVIVRQSADPAAASQFFQLVAKSGVTQAEPKGIAVLLRCCTNPQSTRGTFYVLAYGVEHVGTSNVVAFEYSEQRIADVLANSLAVDLDETGELVKVNNEIISELKSGRRIKQGQAVKDLKLLFAKVGPDAWMTYEVVLNDGDPANLELQAGRLLEDFWMARDEPELQPMLKQIGDAAGGIDWHDGDFSNFTQQSHITGLSADKRATVERARTNALHQFIRSFVRDIPFH
jgi:hypothetical protein